MYLSKVITFVDQCDVETGANNMLWQHVGVQCPVYITELETYNEINITYIISTQFALQLWKSKNPTIKELPQVLTVSNVTPIAVTFPDLPRSVEKKCEPKLLWSNHPKAIPLGRCKTHRMYHDQTSAIPSEKGSRGPIPSDEKNFAKQHHHDPTNEPQTQPSSPVDVFKKNIGCANTKCNE